MTPHYHVWTDALRGRDLAIRATDSWDRGTFVRWSVGSAWTAFESAIDQQIAVSAQGNDFWRSFDAACVAAGIGPPTRASGVWQRAHQVYRLRKKYIHLQVTSQSDLLPSDAEAATNAIIVLREALKDLHVRLGAAPPEWIDDDRLPEHPRSGQATLRVGHGGVDPDSPETIHVAFEYQGKMSTVHMIPGDADPAPYMASIIQDVVIPISAVRAYKNGEVVDEVLVRMRGS